VCVRIAVNAELSKDEPQKTVIKYLGPKVAQESESQVFENFIVIHPHIDNACFW